MAEIPLDKIKADEITSAKEPDQRSEVRGIRKKRKAGKHLMRSFIEEDARDAASYILRDIVVPSAKSLIHEILDRGSARLLWRDGSYSNNRYDSYRNDRPYNNYAKPSSNQSAMSRLTSPRDNSSYSRQQRRSRTSSFVDDIFFDTSKDMEAFVGKLNYILNRQGYVTVEDYYKEANLETEWIDSRFGWYDIRGMTKIRDGEGWVISMPISEEIEETR